MSYAEPNNCKDVMDTVSVQNAPESTFEARARRAGTHITDLIVHHNERGACFLTQCIRPVCLDNDEEEEGLRPIGDTMKTRILSVLLVFLLVISAAAPAAAAPSDIYYKLHTRCLCNANEDLGHIPFLTFGIGYSSRVIDTQTDEWELFVHAGGATKSLLITPDTPTETIITLMEFVNYVDECKEESDPLLLKLAVGTEAAGYAAYKAAAALRNNGCKRNSESIGSFSALS